MSAHTLDTADLAHRRFYGAKSVPIGGTDILAELPTATGTHVIAEITTQWPDGSDHQDLYQLVVGPNGRDVLDSQLDTATVRQLLGAADSPRGATATQLLTLHGELPAVLNAPTAWRRAGEQSNTSWITETGPDDGPEIGPGSVVVKFFRHLTPGINPDVELLTALTEVGCTAIAPLFAHTTLSLPSGEATYVTAMVQQFVDGATDGYNWVVSQLRSSTPTTPPEGVLQALTRLGTAVATVHRDLAAALPTNTRLGSEVATRLVTRARRLVAGSIHLAGYAPQIEQVFRHLTTRDTVPVQRIHGDLHLGQVLKQAEKFYLIDFEGEPAATLTERLSPDSPLRDVAGMIRSFDYACQAAGGSTGAVSGANSQALTQAFLTGYQSLLPVDPVVLDAYILDKALYEVVYEENNRPHMVDVPLTAVQTILADS